MESRNMLVIRGGAIGDFILTLPVLAALRAKFPKAGLEVLGYPHIAQLALLGGMAGSVRSIESRAMAAFFARDGALDSEEAAYFEKFDLIVSFLFDPDAVFRANVARCSKAQFIAGPHRPDETLGCHATACLLKPLERLAVIAADPVPRILGCKPFVAPGEALPLGAAGLQGEAAGSRGFLRDTRGMAEIAIHPGSGSEQKNWSETHWGKFISRLSEETGCRLLLVGGEAEEGRLERLAGHFRKDGLDLAMRLPLRELAGRLSGCSMFVGHDSGISHLAAALGLPCLVLWGDTLEAVWRPLGESVEIVRHEQGLAGITVEEVWRRWAALQ